MLRREETDGGVAATGRLRQHDRNRPSGLRRSDQRLPRRLSEGRGLTTLRGRAAPAAGKAGVSVVRRAGQPDNARSEGLCGRAHGLLPCALRHERMFLRIDAAQAGLACTLAGARTSLTLARRPSRRVRSFPGEATGSSCVRCVPGPPELWPRPVTAVIVPVGSFEVSIDEETSRTAASDPSTAGVRSRAGDRPSSDGACTWRYTDDSSASAGSCGDQQVRPCVPPGRDTVVALRHG